MIKAEYKVYLRINLSCIC